MQRLAVVLSHPTQYYSPWFRWIAAHTDIELRVFYLWNFGVTTTRDPQFQTQFKWDTDLLSGYAHEFVPNTAREPGTHHFRGLQNPDLVRKLSAWRPSAILLFGYKSASHLRTLLWARMHRIPVLFRGDSHFLGRGAPSTLSRWTLRLLYAQFSAFLVVGEANAEYFNVLGVAATRMFRAPHSVDQSLFDPSSAPQRAASARLRTALGISPETRVVLFAGKFVPAKQPRELLEAFLAANLPQTTLVFVGDGPEKLALEQLSKSAPAGKVHFLPFANQTEMPARYLLADLFVLPSRGHYETWGLAVNEAMHLGVPALVSDRVGCQRDLVTDGVTGWVFKVADSSNLRAKLETALNALASRDTREDFRRRVLERISQYTFASTTAGLIAALAGSANAASRR